MVGLKLLIYHLGLVSVELPMLMVLTFALLRISQLLELVIREFAEEPEDIRNDMFGHLILVVEVLKPVMYLDYH